jgi:hypothetical protein
MSEIQLPHTLHFSLNQEKQDCPVSKTRVSGFACNRYNSNFGCCSFYWLVPPLPPPPLRVAGSTDENTYPKAFVSSPLHLLVRFV